MSDVPTEPNSLPSPPAFAVSVSLKPCSFAARACALPSSSPAAFSSSCAPRFELRDVVGRRERRLALRQQEVAAVAGLHLDAVADVAEVGDLLQQNDFHESTYAVTKKSARRYRLDRPARPQPIVSEAPDREHEHRHHIDSGTTSST